MKPRISSSRAARAAATDQDIQISSFRTEHGAEVDFVVEIAGRAWALEVKASRNVGPTDLRELRAFADYHAKRHAARGPYLGDAKRKVDGVDVVPWQEGLREMGL